MNRFYHYLKENKGSETINSCIFVDTETDEIQVDEKRNGHKLRFGWAAHAARKGNGGWAKPDWVRFTDYEAFWLWSMCHTRPRKKTWVWCHNSSFDYPVLHAFTHLPDLGWTLKSAIIDAPPTIVKYTSGSKTLMLVDTLNIWRMSLKELGKKIGLEKLTMPEKWGATEDDDYYCRRDVEIIYKAVTEWSDFLRANGMGGFSPTIASQAMRTFRHRYMHDRILIDSDGVALDVARKSYHGGRCEAFYIGRVKEPVYSLDVNSMYPYVMSYCEMPLRIRGIARTVQVRHLARLLQQYCLVAHVRVNTQEPVFPLVHEGKLCFPTGRFDCYLSTPELSYGLAHNMIEEVHLVASYDKGVPFRDFALDLYAHKEAAVRDGRDIEARHWKLLLNSFYGKFGQGGRHWVKVGTCDPDDFGVFPDINAQSLKKTHVRHFGGLVLARSDEAESRESHPAIAAHVTAEARMVLWTLIRQCPAKTYLYCDTDGLLVTQAGFDALRERMHDSRLGFLKHQATFSDTVIHGCKDLVLDGKATLKGIRGNAVKVGDASFRQLKWSSLAGLLRSNSLNMPLTVMVDKTLSRTYTKGVVGRDGFVSPLHFPLPSS